MHFRLHPTNRRLLQGFLKAGDHVCDATCGNGHDTLYLAQEVLPQGHVYAIDIQAQALAATRTRLEEAGYEKGITYLQADHQDIASLIPSGLALIYFNLGYLPRSDQQVRTQAASTLAALQAGLMLLAPGGILSVMVYFDPPEGPAEAHAIQAWARQLPAPTYAVFEAGLSNMPNHPPQQIMIQKQAP